MLILKECHSGVLGCEIKHCKQLEAGEKTQKLRVLAAFKEVQSSFPSTHSRKLTTPVPLAPRDLMHSSVVNYTHTHVNIHRHKKK